MKQLSHYDIQNQQQKFPITIVCDAIRTPENIGMCFRVAESFGVSKIYLHESSPNLENRIVKKTARNTINQIENETYTDFDILIERLKEEGNVIIGIEITDQSINIRNFNFKNHKKIRGLPSAPGKDLTRDLSTGMCQAHQALGCCYLNKYSDQYLSNTLSDEPNDDHDYHMLWPQMKPPIF